MSLSLSTKWPGALKVGCLCNLCQWNLATYLLAQLRLVQPAIAWSKLARRHHGHIHAACAHLLAQAGSKTVHGGLCGALDATHRWRNTIQARGKEYHTSMGAAHQGQKDLSQTRGSLKCGRRIVKWDKWREKRWSSKLFPAALIYSRVHFS